MPGLYLTTYVALTLMRPIMRCYVWVLRREGAVMLPHNSAYTYNITKSPFPLLLPCTLNSITRSHTHACPVCMNSITRSHTVPMHMCTYCYSCAPLDNINAYDPGTCTSHRNRIRSYNTYCNCPCAA